jgi:hypothetical protein
MERNKASVIPLQNLFSMKQVINQKRFFKFRFFLHDTPDNHYFQGYFIIMTLPKPTKNLITGCFFISQSESFWQLLGLTTS